MDAIRRPARRGIAPAAPAIGSRARLEPRAPGRAQTLELRSFTGASLARAARPPNLLYPRWLLPPADLHRTHLCGSTGPGGVFRRPAGNVFPPQLGGHAIGTGQKACTPAVQRRRGIPPVVAPHRGTCHRRRSKPRQGPVRKLLEPGRSRDPNRRNHSTTPGDATSTTARGLPRNGVTVSSDPNRRRSPSSWAT
jgi:hypothetical protein